MTIFDTQKRLRPRLRAGVARVLVASTFATLVGVPAQATYKDESGNLPGIISPAEKWGAIGGGAAAAGLIVFLIVHHKRAEKKADETAVRYRSNQNADRTSATPGTVAPPQPGTLKSASQDQPRPDAFPAQPSALNALH